MTTDERILILMPTVKDGERTRRALSEAGLDGVVCEDMDALCREIAAGAGLALLTEELMGADRRGRLQDALREQPPWSDFPLVILALEGGSRGQLIRESMNATLIERPVKIRTLLSVVRAALRSRRRQYEIRAHLEERRAAETIRRERERYRVTLGSIGDAVIATDAEGRVRFMNGVAESLTGSANAEAEGRGLPEVFRIVNEHTREPVESPALRALREGVIVGLANHTILIARDGTERPIDDSAAPIRDGEAAPAGAVLVFRDVTERKRAEEAQARLAAIVESSEDAIVSKSLDGTILSWNAAAERLFGYRAGEAVGKPITLIIPPERLAEEPGILERLRRGERVEHFETVRLTKGGQRIDISLTISPVLNPAGEVIGASKVARDVTQRKRADAALRESEERFRALVTATSDVVYRMSLDWAEMRHLDGRQFIADTDEPSRSWLEKYIPPEEQPRVTAAFAAAVRDRKAFELEHRVLRVDGSAGWTFSRAVPVLGPDGEVAEWFGAASDVTRRKQAEEDLAASRARLDYAVRASGIGFWYCDLPFDVLTWDERVKEHFWLSPDATVTIETFYERIHPDDREPTRLAIEASIRERTPYDVNYRTVEPASGAVKWVRALGGTAYALDGAPARFDGVTVDVTTQKLNEERLARALEREREQAELLKRVADAALTIHSAGSLDSVLRVIAEEARHIVGAHQAVSSLTAGDDWAQAINTVAVSEKYARWQDYDEPPTGAGIYSVVCQTNRPMRLTQAELATHPAWRDFSGEGARHPPLRGWLAAPLVNRGGKNLGLIQVSDRHEGDFTERDEAVITQLAHIASVAIENARLNEELRQSDRKKDEFIALLAHELRNPLAPIRNGLQVMRMAGAGGGEVAQAREMMDRQLTHLVRLVDDLLDISRISRNKMELRRERLLLPDVVSAAVETARPLIDAGGHQLTVSLPEETVYLDADLTRLAQVFGNLLTNSAKYTPHGGKVWLTARLSGGEVTVSVRDTGVGIPAEELPRVFDMFSQVDRSLERSTGGLGIGLALVKGLVEMHDGTVNAASEGEGKGSTFSVTLPVLADRQKQAFAVSDNGPASAGPKRRILVVDDNRDGADSLAIMLRLMGNEVQTANDGIAAVERAEVFKPVIVLMDVGMPRLNGLDATRRIREQEWGRDIRIIALTGWGQAGDKKRSREAGCDGHLVKPVNMDDLQKLLGELRNGTTE